MKLESSRWRVWDTACHVINVNTRVSQVALFLLTNLPLFHRAAGFASWVRYAGLASFGVQDLALALRGKLFQGDAVEGAVDTCDFTSDTLTLLLFFNDAGLFKLPRLKVLEGIASVTWIAGLAGQTCLSESKGDMAENGLDFAFALAICSLGSRHSYLISALGVAAGAYPLLRKSLSQMSS